ncbi:MAG TPA: protein kinase [Gaiellaceae bacterium]|nr:protein kinase [Gaiellaceae bacterium]
MATTSDSFAGGRYVVERTLGRGGMSTVYLARDAALDRPVAIKVLEQSLAADDAFARRFRREAQVAAQLAHPNIVQIFDTGEDERRLFIVMEYVDGEGLERVLEREGRLEPAHVADVGVQACAALEAAHSRGVVHRDVKPANLLRRHDGVLKVVDFGIARPAQATQLTQVGTILGTLNYLAPEQARGEEVTTAADVYSLGVVLYELYTGRPPRRFETLVHLAGAHDEPVTPVRELAPDVPPNAEDAVMRCLARDPRHRPASPAEVADALTGTPRPEAVTVPFARGIETGPARDAEQPTRATAPLRRERPGIPILTLVLGIALAAVIALGVYALARESRGGADPAPAEIEPVPRLDDAAEQAREFAEWIRDHTRRD